MNKLYRFTTETRQVNMDDLLAEIEAEEADGNGRIRPGDICYHVDFPDFQCRVVSTGNGRSKVKVLAGWRGDVRPMHPVSVPTAKLEVVTV